jgi:excisionase family DNA binding protein
MTEYLTISEAAEYLGVSEQTLRRWDEDGSFKPSFVSPGGHRKYSMADLVKLTGGLFQVAKEWAGSAVPATLPDEFYCPQSDIFRSRLDRLAHEMETHQPMEGMWSLVVLAAGEIGNNSFDHNLGNWPDLPGAFFAYDLGKRIIVLADRGLGILTTLRRVRPELADDQAALRLAFTELTSGRAPEHRGNGLKAVKIAAAQAGFRLRFQSGDAELELAKGQSEPIIRRVEAPIRGCMALIEF